MNVAPHLADDERAADWQSASARVMALGLAFVDALLRDAAAPSPEGAGTARDMRAIYRREREAMLKLGAGVAVDRLAALFDLAPVDEDILLLALAPLLRGDLAARLAALGNRTQAASRVTPALLGRLLAPGADEAVFGLWQRLSPEAPLRRHRLIEIAEPVLGPETPIFLDERIARLLVGETIAERRLAGMLFAVPPLPLPARHRAGIAALAADLGPGRQPLVAISGAKGSGREAAALALARHFDLALWRLRPDPAMPLDDLAALAGREAMIGGFALLVDAGDPAALALLHRRIDALVIAIGEARPELAHAVPHLGLPPLEPGDHAELWRQALRDGRAADALGEQFRFGPSEIAAIAAEGGDIWQACREQAARAMGALATRITPRHDFDDLVLPAEAMADLGAIVAQMRHRALVYGAHGFGERLSRGRGVSVLFAGPSGTGKTMAAEVIAGAIGLDLYRVDLSAVVSKYIGETEKNLKAVFDAAEASGSVLFLDEADALCGKRSEVKDSHDRYANIEVSYLLQRMESYDGLAILATNLKGNLDAAFLRRLRFAIDIPFPDAALRRRLWQRAFPEAQPRGVLDFDALARLEIAGGNIVVIAVNAAFLAAAEGLPLEMRHVARAARSEFRKLDKEFRAPFAEARS